MTSPLQPWPRFVCIGRFLLTFSNRSTSTCPAYQRARFVSVLMLSLLVSRPPIFCLSLWLWGHDRLFFFVSGSRRGRSSTRGTTRRSSAAPLQVTQTTPPWILEVTQAVAAFVTVLDALARLGLNARYTEQVCEATCSPIAKPAQSPHRSFRKAFHKHFRWIQCICVVAI